LNTLLEKAYWVPTLKGDTAYSRRQDDTDGSTAPIHDLTVFIDFQGDVWMPRHDDLRFRTHAGGGASLRVRHDLRWRGCDGPAGFRDASPRQPATHLWRDGVTW
jgi:hypothetical protein